MRLAASAGGKPRAIFAAIAPSNALESLQRAHERAARAAGLPPEPRNYTPHVTRGAAQRHELRIRRGLS